jgi:hypothetical protein
MRAWLSLFLALSLGLSQCLSAPAAACTGGVSLDQMAAASDAQDLLERTRKRLAEMIGLP